MATNPERRRPALGLVIFLLVIALMYGIMAATKSWTPRLGLDLQGGMTITLTATNRQVAPESLETAADIIQQRVDSLGVGEASVTTSGDRYIIVSAPNVQRDDLVELVGSTAQLAFRQVMSIDMGTGTTLEPEDQDEGPGLPTAPGDPQEADDDGEGVLLEIPDVLAYQPTADEEERFAEFECGDDAPEIKDRATWACDSEGQFKYFLGPVALEGEMVNNATAGIPQGALTFAVSLDFNQEGGRRLADFTGSLVTSPEPRNQFAVVLDGVVESNARVTERIPGGQAQISGDFTQPEAQQLANVLKFGALPLSFETSQVETVSPTLGGEQLRMGLIAGIIGLLLVVIYAFVYYRALGLVILGSLVVAAGTTYAAMVLLGDAVGFTLNLPAIAGAVVSIGMTADSFIIYFERIRDEVREGRSLRSALTTGWRKARGTIVVADLVSLLSAVVLFFLAAGSVQGFAFMLGLTTVIDLIVVFFFTVPVMHLLGRIKFFRTGHKLSGLNADRLGATEDSLMGRRTRRPKASKQKAEVA